MPIGASKSGLLGAGIVPGGSETFNSSGTFVAPPGVNNVSITGYGAPGCPGAPGNQAGIGAGGAGGNGGIILSKPNCSFSNDPSAGRLAAATTGGAGSAGNSSSPGAPGPDGAASTVFCISLSGGTGGAGGAAAPNGQAGNNGAIGGSINFGCGTPGPGGTGGNAGGGTGANGARFAYLCIKDPSVNYTTTYGGGGGGGAGSINPGCNGVNINSSGQNQPAAPGGSLSGGPGGLRNASFWYGGQNPLPGRSLGNPGVSGGSFGAGGGGGSGEALAIGVFAGEGAGGGGGGGRGLPGNLPACPGLPGSAANPSTQNCVSISGGASYPVTVNGQVNISWCPQ